VNAAQTEAWIASEVRKHLEQQGMDVYGEVTLEARDCAFGENQRADLVAVRGDTLMVVECKRGFELLAQGRRWLPFANAVFIAVLSVYGQSIARREAVRLVREHYGFGLYVVGDEGVKRAVEPRPGARASEALLKALRPEHKVIGIPGSPGGGQWTTFKETCRNLQAFVREHEGCTLGEAIEGIRHHYRSRHSAFTALGRCIDRGEIDGVHRGWRQRLWSTVEGAMRGYAVGAESAT